MNGRPFPSSPPTEALPPPFTADFYERDADCVARDLLGAVLVRHGERRTCARIVEAEAYMGEHDLASHARFGRTPRTEVMYGTAGHCYVYLIYGMYDMLNVVCGPAGTPHAVLVRALQPLDGAPGRLDGPGRLTRTLEIDRSFNSLPLWRPPLTLHPGTPCSEPLVTSRIGIDYAAEWKDAPLRFVVPGFDTVTRRARRG